MTSYQKLGFLICLVTVYSCAPDELEIGYQQAKQARSIDLSFKYLESANDPGSLAKGHYLIAHIYESEGKYDSAVYHANSAVEYYAADNNEQRQAFTYQMMAKIFDATGAYQLAQAYYDSAMSYNYKLDYINWLAIEKAKGLLRLEEYSTALQLLEQASDYFKSKDEFLWAEANLILGNVKKQAGFSEKDDLLLHESLEHYSLAIAAYNRVNTNTDDVVPMGNYKNHAMNNMGQVYTHFGDYRMAQDNLNEALRLHKSPKEFASSYYNLGVLAYKQGHYDEAVTYHEKSLENSFTWNEEVDKSYKMLSSIYFDRNDKENFERISSAYFSGNKKYREERQKLIDMGNNIHMQTLLSSYEQRRLIRQKRQNAVVFAAISTIVSVILLVSFFFNILQAASKRMLGKELSKYLDSK